MSDNAANAANPEVPIKECSHLTEAQIAEGAKCEEAAVATAAAWYATAQFWIVFALVVLIIVLVVFFVMRQKKAREEVAAKEGEVA